MRPSGPGGSSPRGQGAGLCPSSPGTHLSGLGVRDARLWEQVSRGGGLRQRGLLGGHRGPVFRLPGLFRGLLRPVKWCP